MATLPQFRQRQLARRTGSDITRLANQFNVGMRSLTEQYESEFAKYQRAAAEKMGAYDVQSAAYKTALDKYTTDVVTPYLSSLADYENKRKAYQQELDQIGSGAKDFIMGTTEWKEDKYMTVLGFIEPGTGRKIRYDVIDNPQKYGYADVLTPIEAGRRGKNEYVFRPMPSQPAPTPVERPADFAMEQPTPPEIAEFDQAPFEEKKKRLREDFSREVAERKAGRLGAVSRRASRPLLQGV